MENKTDKLFREGLANHREEPPPHLWEQIANSSASKPPAPNGQSSFRPGAKWLLLPLLLLLISTGYWLWRQETDSSSRLLPEEESKISGLSEMTLPGDAPHVGHPDNTTAHIPHGPPSRQPAFGDVERWNNSTLIHKEAAASSLLSAAIVPVQKGTIVETEALREIPGMDTLENSLVRMPDRSVDTPAFAFRSSENSPESSFTESDDKDSIGTPGPGQSGAGAYKPSNPGITGFQWGLSWYFAPFIYRSVWYDDPHPGFGYESVINVHLNYGRAHFFTGPGLSTFLDKHLWNARVIMYDTTGFYPDVTDVNFIPVYNPIDSSITGYEMDVVTKVDKPVVDTSHHTVSIESTSRTTYLQVPLLIGYDVLLRKNLSVRMETGLVYQRRIVERSVLPKVEGELVPGSMLNLAPVRKDHFWYYQVGMGLWYDLSPQWHVGGQLNLRKPLSGWYLNDQNQHKPVSMMLGAGIGFWF